MRRRSIRFLPKAELERWPTERLLARLRTLQQCEDAAEFSDRGPSAAASGEILFKDTREWRQAHADLKAILASREHIERAG